MDTLSAIFLLIVVLIGRYFMFAIVINFFASIFGAIVGSSHDHAGMGFLLGLFFGVLGVVVMALVNISEGKKPVTPRRPRRY